MFGRSRDILLIIGVICAISAYFLFFAKVVDQKEGVVFYLRPGSSKKIVLNDLKEQAIIKHPFFFSLYVYFDKNASLKTGEYLLPQGSTLYSIWKQFKNGKGHYYRSFTIVPGWTFAQLMQQIQATESLKHQKTTQTKQEIMAALGAPTIDPEGEFFPETYLYTRDVLDLVILERAYSLMQSRLKELWEGRTQGLPYKNPYEMLIVASLVEKEAYVNTERKIIAGVIINRLNKNMLLQIDPTVIYGMGENYHGAIHRQDLLNDTIYNTYKRKGLPPTPIAMPSLASLEAAANPDVHNYYYFVAKGDGSHQFSETLTDHHIAVDHALQGKQNVAR